MSSMHAILGLLQAAALGFSAIVLVIIVIFVGGVRRVSKEA